MRSAAGREKTTAGALIAVLIISAMAAIPLQAHQLEKSKRWAGTQHEIVMLLIQKKEFEKAASEADKIFEKKWPEDQEPLLLRELLIISEQFRQNGQAALSLRLIDKNSKCFKTKASRIAILKEIGYLHRSMNQYDKAIDYFQKARELEENDD